MPQHPRDSTATLVSEKPHHGRSSWSGVKAPGKHSSNALKSQKGSPDKSTPVLVIHGGAGSWDVPNIPPKLQVEYRMALQQALRQGQAVLSSGGNALDAVCMAVRSLEDCALFNSGHGAVFNAKGKNELEASVMTSRPPGTTMHDARSSPLEGAVPASRRAASVALVTRTKNPILLARALYLDPDANPHVWLSGLEAEQIGWEKGCEKVDPSYFWTERRWLEHRRGLGLPDYDAGQSRPCFSAEPEGDNETKDDFEFNPADLPKGTVGAVARDAEGRIACATSTGGYTNKLAGRIGDTPTPGAGFWAETWTTKCRDNRFRKLLSKLGICKALPDREDGLGLSGTGNGDYFLRTSFASLVARRMRFLGEPVQTAAERAIEELGSIGGAGGCICVDAQGNVAMPFNSGAMFRGIVRGDGTPKVAIYRDEELT